MTTPGHTCVHCGLTSHNPTDAAEHYCGACHHFCDDPQLSDHPLWDEHKECDDAPGNL